MTASPAAFPHVNVRGRVLPGRQEDDDPETRHAEDRGHVRNVTQRMGYSKWLSYGRICRYDY